MGYPRLVGFRLFSCDTGYYSKCRLDPSGEKPGTLVGGLGFLITETVQTQNDLDTGRLGIPGTKLPLGRSLASARSHFSSADL